MDSRGDESARAERGGRGGRVRPAAVAGQFYPAHGGSLEHDVRGYLDAARAEADAEAVPGSPKAIIAPHAGYLYSGPVAGSAYARVAHRRDEIERVVLLGPSHRVPLEGLAVPAHDAFETPLGRIELDRQAIERARSLPQVRELDGPHAMEHSLEVHLPFLQVVLGDFRLAPFAVGDASAAEVEEVLELLWGGAETLIVVSSDLSHYYDYETARLLDASTTRAIVELAPERLGPESACGRVPARGLLRAARRHGLRARAVDVRSSGDTAGPRDRVVGYGSYVFG
ncbi:MAG: AmmeMemoRadiSam system protein B [Myxococcota bacterium]